MLINTYRNFSHFSCYNFVLINAYRNFSTFSYFITSYPSMHTAPFFFVSFLITSCWSMHTETFSFLLCYNFMLISAYRNFSTFSYVITWCSSLPSSIFPLFPMLYILADLCIPQLFHFLFCYNFMVVNVYRNFSFFSFVITLCWWMDTATFPLSPLLSLNADQCTPQTFHFLLCYNFMFIIAYLNFSTFSYVITCCWSMYTATFPLSPLL